MAVFSKILIANRSEIARRVIRTCASMGIATVAVFSEHDADAPFVHDADEAVALPAGSSYLDIDAIVEAARRTEAAAVHPGYGFLAENASFAAAVEAAGMVFIGPDPATISAMGSKLRSRSLMEQVGVPLLLSAEIDVGSDISAAASEIGYPVLVKASSGGGGKGMRIVTEPSSLDDAIAAATREAESAFGDGTVYLEKYVEQPRHIEVQILGDGTGNVVHLYERECSIQRRFQKIIEESPSPGLDDELRQELWQAAVAAGQAVNYRGAGTVEFIVDADGGFAFLEMNTRLQVEHPVTEMTTGLDLVHEQIAIAAGVPLMSQHDVPAQYGHAIEARLNAERPAHGYLPSTGVVRRFGVDADVRVDTGIEEGSEISHHYDPMVAKVISHAPSRGEAAARLSAALQRAKIHGVDTNRDLLVGVLTDEDFLAGAVDTHFLDRKGNTLSRARATSDVVSLHAAVAALALQVDARHRATVQTSLPSGWRNVQSQVQQRTLAHEDDELDIGYRIGGAVTSMTVNESAVNIDHVYSATSSCVDISVDGVRRTFDVDINLGKVYVDSALAATVFVQIPRFEEPGSSVDSGSMIAKTPGTVVAVQVDVGDVVGAGDVVMIIEAMKMEQAIVAPEAGHVSAVHFAVGDQVRTGETLVEAETDG